MTFSKRPRGFRVIRPYVSNLALYALVFLLAYRFGMSFSQSLSSPFWFPDSVLLCTLLVSEPGTWWVYILAALPIRLFLFVPPGTPLWFLVACFLNDSLKGLLSAWLLRRISRPTLWLDGLREYTKYFLIAVILSPALSALAGAATRVYIGDDFGRAWRNWFLGDALASLVLTPLLVCLVIGHRSLGQYSKKFVAAGLSITASLTLAGYITFNRGLGGQSYPPFLLYMPVPFLLIAAVFFGPIGASLTLLLTSLLAIFGTIAGRGPFYQESAAVSLVSIQLFLFFVSVPFMFLSVLIGQQQKTDSSLRESEKRFRSLVDTAPVLVWMSGTDAACTFFNKPWLDFTGRSLAQELGNGWADSVHAEDVEGCKGQYLSAFESRRSFTLEYRLRRNDGVYRWILDNGIPRYGSDGNFLGYIGTCIDITDRKEAEDRLRQISAQLIHAQEAERFRIGQELHDDFSQRAAALSMGLTYLARKFEGEESTNKFDELQQQAMDLCKDIADLSHRLRPAALERLGLAVALRGLCRQSTDDGHTVTLTCDEHLPKLSNEVAISLYRIAQEALRNALAHSGASRIYVEL
jgi:PAS domain S-box-containing protein